MNSPTRAFTADHVQPLSALGSWGDSVHHFDRASALAVHAALAAGRPLLVRGEPGTGKSQLARAVAARLGRMFVSDVVHARTEAQALMWRYDTVARLGEAQALGASNLDPAEVRSLLANERYISPGPLWWAFDYASALRQYNLAGKPGGIPPLPPAWKPGHGAVLLIDEIDKAESDVPNALLEALANGAFPVPWQDQAVKSTTENPPLVVITSNDERELPVAFVRRCLVLNLTLPANEDEFIALLAKRAALHFGETMFERSATDLYRKAASMLWVDREAARVASVPLPGQAEYLDLLRALRELCPNGDQALVWLEDLRGFTLGKHQRPELE